MVIWQGYLKIRPGARQEYINALNATNLVNRFRKHKGNIFYVIGASLTDSDMIEVCDAWASKDDFVAHDASGDVDIWRNLYQAYVISCESKLYELE